MKAYNRLFELLCELIDIQIKKYKALANIGVGPDARLNSKVVFDEVEELLTSALTLLHVLKNEAFDNKIFKNIFNQIKFYLKQENLRLFAAFLIDENNIHNTAYARTNSQLKELNEIANIAGINFDETVEPINDTQKQCEYDSNSIACKILVLAIKLQEDPTMEFDETIPKHAHKPLRKNAKSRYQNPSINKDIRDLCTKCKTYLDSNPNLKPSPDQLDRKTAKEKADLHRNQLNELLTEFKKIEPNANLFSKEHEWHKVGVPSDQPKSVGGYKNYGLFAGTAIATGTLLYALYAYFQSGNDLGLSETFRLNQQ